MPDYDSKPEVPDLMKNLRDSIDQARALSRELRSRDDGLYGGDGRQVPANFRPLASEDVEALRRDLRSRDQACEAQNSSKTEDRQVGLGFTSVDIDEWLESAVRSGGVIDTVEVRSKLPENFFDDRPVEQERRFTIRFTNGAEFRSDWEAML